MAHTGIGYQLTNRQRELSRWRLRAFSVGMLCLAATVVATQQLPPLVIDDEALVEDPELRRYTVELIVFSYADSVYAGTEIFIPDPVEVLQQTSESVTPVDALGDELRPNDDAQSAIFPDPEMIDDATPAFGDLLPEIEDVELVELVSADTIDLQVLMPDQLTMMEIHKKLVLLDAYEPVLWAGWTQVILAEEETPTIRLRRLGGIPLTFEGTVKLYLSRFLHLVVDIAMEGESSLPESPLPAVPTRQFERRFEQRNQRQFGRRFSDNFDDPFESALPKPEVHYQIIENRIVKNDEIRYFDHPKFGVLAKVTRNEAPEEGVDLENVDEQLNQIVPGAALSQSN